MNVLKYGCCLLALLLAHGAFAAHTSFPFLKTEIIVPDSAEAAAVLGTDDGYAAYFSTFDLQSKTNSKTTTARSQYYKYAAKQARSWTAAEAAKLQTVFAAIADSMNSKGIALNLPEKVYIIKSSCKEEYGASGYTRSGEIVLKGSEDISVHLVSHELFHVFSRYNVKKRDELYNVFYFKRCNAVALGKAFNNLNITNPDCPEIAHYIHVDSLDGALVLYSTKPYAGGNVFQDYIQVGFAVLEGGDANKTVKMENGKPVIKELQNIPSLFSYIGTNTNYVIHPEEIAAEHFSMIAAGDTPRQPELLEKFLWALKN